MSSDKEAVERYQKAAQEWDQRIGSAKTQARSWRLACLACLGLSILLLIALIALLMRDKTYVYVAQVKPGETVAHIVPLQKPVTPNQTQELAFVSGFVSDIMELPLDPVVLRNNWLQAYARVGAQARQQLTDWARKHQPFAKVGEETRVMQVKNFHPLSDNTYDLSWTVTTYNMQGQVQDVAVYNGSFTLTQGPTPSTLNGMLGNPFGLQIVYFNISREG